MKKLLLLTPVVALCAFYVANAQDILVVKMNNNSVRQFDVKNINELTFSSSSENNVYLSCPDKYHPHMIDLGLPSGTKWACCNIGALSPEQDGGSYAWGETWEKDVYSQDTYKYFGDEGYVNIGNDIAGTEYDVAHTKWKGAWQMPSKDQIKELLDNCVLTHTRYNNVNGTLFTGPNGTTIFLPFNNYFSSALYWSSSSNWYPSFIFVYALFCGDYHWAWNESMDPWHGNLVRPIINPEEPHADPSCPVAEAIDLGLPSGTKWAGWNVGASAPEEYGGYYAWGETEEKDEYDWSTYIFYDSPNKTCRHIGDDISGTRYDVAHVKWGDSWRMPTADQWVELMENCSMKKVTQNEVAGFLLTGPNGATIFMPFDYNSLFTSSYYWSSSLCSYGEYSALVPDFLNWEYNFYFCSEFTRQTGCFVRAVCP